MDVNERFYLRVQLSILRALRLGHKRLYEVCRAVDRDLPGTFWAVERELYALKRAGLVYYAQRSPGVAPGWRKFEVRA